MAKDIQANIISKFKLNSEEEVTLIDSLNYLKSLQDRTNKSFTTSSKSRINANMQYPFSFLFDKKTGSINSLKFDNYEWNSTISSFKNIMQVFYCEGLSIENFPKEYYSELKNIELIDSGLVSATYKVICAMRGTNEVQYIITQYNGANVLKLSTIIDKKAIREKEAIHVAFPFNLKNVTDQIGIGDTCFTPEHGQLAASNKDFYAVQRWIDVSDAKHGITISSPQCALFEVGSIIDERRINNGQKLWKTSNTSSPTLFAYLVNNYWHTNFKADQDGEIQYDFYLNFHKRFSKKEALRFGYEMNEPLLVMYGRD